MNRPTQQERILIETSAEKDACGFAFHRLVREPAAKQLTIAP